MQKLISKFRAVAGLPLDSIDEDTRLYESLGGDYRLLLSEPHGQGRFRVQQFIAGAYDRVFSAKLTHFYPSLITLRTTDQEICGAAGARYAGGQDLFIEQYLPLPIEVAIRRQFGICIHRQNIVEIGSLSVTRPAMTYPFISMIGGWLQTYDVKWLAFVLTRTLRRLFQRAGVELLDLGMARQECLMQQRDDWGTYYEHEPRVMAARLTSGLDSFQIHHSGPGNARFLPRRPELPACQA